MKRLLLGLLGSLAGCQAASPLGPSPLALTVTIETEPVIPTANAAQPWRARWRVRIHETAGLESRLRAVNATVRDAASGARVLPQPYVFLASGALEKGLGSDRLPPDATVVVPGVLEYALPSGGRSATLDVAVQIEDDDGHRTTALARAELR